MSARPPPASTHPNVALTLAALALVMAQPALASQHSLPSNLPWAEDVKALASKAVASARAAAAPPATTTGFVVARKNIARELADSASAAVSSSASATPTSLSFADTVIRQAHVLAQHRLALVVGVGVALALFLAVLIFCCCRFRRAAGEEATPTTPFADRATSLPTSKGRRRSYKTLHD